MSARRDVDGAARPGRQIERGPAGNFQRALIGPGARGQDDRAAAEAGIDGALVDDVNAAGPLDVAVVVVAVADVAQGTVHRHGRAKGQRRSSRRLEQAVVAVVIIITAEGNRAVPSERLRAAEVQVSVGARIAERERAIQGQPILHGDRIIAYDLEVPVHRHAVQDTAGESQRVAVGDAERAAGDRGRGGESARTGQGNGIAGVGERGAQVKRTRGIGVVDAAILPVTPLD